jgi:hypothetical protein
MMTCLGFLLVGDASMAGEPTSELSRVDRDWWQHMPPEIRKNAETRKQRSQVTWPWYPPTSTNVVDYLDFSDYRRIVLEPNNWQGVFSRFFGTESFVQVRLGELEPIRNDLAHSRSLTQSAVDKLRMFSRDLQDCMKSR